MKAIADVIDIISAKASLKVGQAFPRRMRFSHEKGNQGMHSRSGEKDRWVVLGHERGAGDDTVPALSKVLQIEINQFYGLHVQTTPNHCTVETKQGPKHHSP